MAPMDGRHGEVCNRRGQCSQHLHLHHNLSNSHALAPTIVKFPSPLPSFILKLLPLRDAPSACVCQ